MTYELCLIKVENNLKWASHFLINENRKSSDHVINCDVRRAFVFDESSWKINYVSKYDHHCTKKQLKTIEIFLQANF